MESKHIQLLESLKREMLISPTTIYIVDNRTGNVTDTYTTEDRIKLIDEIIDIVKLNKIQKK